MSPFLAEEFTLKKADGTTFYYKDGKLTTQPESAASPQDMAKASPGSTPSKHHRSDSDGMDGTVVPVVAIVFVFIWLIIKALMAPFTQKAARRGLMSMGGSPAGLTDEEQAVLLKLQRTLADMERRIESLETILIDEHRTKENYGSKI